MINNYEIKNENNEEILCIYIDFNNEFANFDFNTNSNEKKEKLEDKIKKFITKNKINFKGTKIIILVGGIIMGTLLLNKPIYTNTENYTSTMAQTIQQEVTKEKEEVAIKQTNDIEETTINNNSEITKENKEEFATNNTSEIKQTQTLQKENTNKSNITQKAEQIENTNTSQKQQTNTEKVKSNVKTEETENQIFVTVYRSNGTIATIELEEYVIGVVGAEMPASFHQQALMTQSIIARTYALKSIESNKVLTDNSSTQNYKDNSQLKSMWGNSYNLYYNKVKQAVKNTSGIYLTYNGQTIDAVYHSTSNGYTEAAKNVWGKSFAYLVSVESPYDSANPSFEKETSITYEELSEKLQNTITSDTQFNVLGYTDGKRIENIEINGIIYTGVEFRNLLGLRSADFEITKNENSITITTKGYGHGVGLSQYGANGMAKNGYTYEQIIKHYYKGVKLTNI